MPIVPLSHLYGWSIVVYKMFIIVARTRLIARNPQTQLNQLVQLSEVLDGTDHLRGVAVLVVARRKRRAWLRQRLRHFHLRFLAVFFICNDTG